MQLNNIVRTVLIFIGIYILYKNWQKIKEFININDAQSGTDDIGSKSESKLTDGRKSRLKILAQQIKNAWGIPYLTNDNENAVYSAFNEVKNQDEYYTLRMYYGVEDGNDLKSILQDKLSDSEYLKCETIASKHNYIIE